MIKEITIDDKDSFISLGSLIKSDFVNTNNLDKIIESDYEKVFAYYLGDKVVGFIYISKSYENIDIIDIVVDTEYRRRGIATSLIEYVVDKYKDINSIFLEVNSNNESAIKTYEKNGFKTVNIRKKYYGNDDAIVMKRDV